MSQQMKTDLLDASRLEWYTRQDSNLRPLAPQANALSSWATGAQKN